MTLLITLVSAIICTIIWYNKFPNDVMKVSILCYMYWGASLMWLVDAIFEYAELKDVFFKPSLDSLLNDTILGFSAVALGLVIWIVILLVKDPKGTIKTHLTNKYNVK